jgi:hypothetical protein
MRTAVNEGYLASLGGGVKAFLIIPFDSCHPCLYYILWWCLLSSWILLVLLVYRLLCCEITPASPKSNSDIPSKEQDTRHNNGSNSGIEEEEKEAVEFSSDKETPSVEMNAQIGRDVWKLNHCIVSLCMIITSKQHNGPCYPIAEV